MSKIFTVLLFLIFTSHVYVERFSYAEKSELEWSDFRGNPDVNSDFDSAVNTGISYQWTIVSKDEERIKLKYEIESFCYPLLSWVKKGQSTSYLLAHEQLHFDISELHARIIRKKFKDYTPSSDKNIKKDLNRMYKRVERMRINMQEKYDAETDHSRKKIAQMKWEDKIKILMWYYRDYAK